MNFLSPVWMEMVADLFNFDILARVWRTWTGTDDDQLVSCSDSEIEMHEIIRTAPAATSHKQYQLVVFSPAPPALPATESDGRKSSSSRHQMNLMERESQKEPRLNFLRDKFCQMCHDKCIR